MNPKTHPIPNSKSYPYARHRCASSSLVSTSPRPSARSLTSGKDSSESSRPRAGQARLIPPPYPLEAPRAGQAQRPMRLRPSSQELSQGGISQEPCGGDRPGAVAGEGRSRRGGISQEPCRRGLAPPQPSPQARMLSPQLASSPTSLVRCFLARLRKLGRQEVRKLVSLFSS